MASAKLRTWITHNITYREGDCKLDAIHGRWHLYCSNDCLVHDDFIMSRESMKKRLGELAREDNPVIEIIGKVGSAKDGGVKYRKIERRPESRPKPIETRSVLSDLGKRVFDAMNKGRKIMVSRWP